jgi:hypothetical protein
MLTRTGWQVQAEVAWHLVSCCNRGAFYFFQDQGVETIFSPSETRCAVASDGCLALPYDNYGTLD